MLTIFDEEFARDPWPVLAHLREDGGVHRVATPDGPPAWLVTRFDQVRAGLLDERLSTNLRFAQGNDYRGFAVPAPLDVFQSSDAEDLARLRRTVVGALQPRRTGEWAEPAGDLVRRCLAAVREDEFDFVERVAVPLPAAVLGDLLGLAAAEREALLNWANSTLRPDGTLRARDTLATMGRIITGTLEHARAAGDDTVLGRLVGTGRTAAGLDSGQLAGLLFYLLFVWYEVLADLISGAVLTFSQWPALVGALGPDGAVVDELVRHQSPQVLAGPRFAVTDLDLGGYRVRAGETVLLCLAAANHDPDRFARPEEPDHRRGPNAHLGLGLGAHACVGTALVRTVTTAVLEQIYAQWPGLRATADQVPWRSGFRHRGPLTLPVKVG
ncbi:cytochrome P450 [Nocardia aurantia]|uniref:Polyketide biosynthesis cytochrome P450 PksS n=1 Tax=Nocardia aurantia TaxID=2585199 RepID=A0A7K0DUB3_9NOCA|nr:cytochrome P450 [Nocardia aurantia]MQY29336.1 Polyketide biosynthesis cytochrome P450 PksS [Nocardia aurantia]